VRHLLQAQSDQKINFQPWLLLCHQTCAEFYDPRLICAHCGEEITAQNMTPEAGPAFGTKG
jgi:hypothetical protein